MSWLETYPLVLALEEVDSSGSLKVRQEPDGIGFDESLLQLDETGLTLRPLSAAILSGGIGALVERL